MAKITKLSNGGELYEDDYNTKYWYVNDKLHREDGPAIESANFYGYKEWYLNNKLHREAGPAIESANGDKEWYVNDKLHREDGPAIEAANGDKEWYVNGEHLPCTTQVQFERLMRLKAFGGDLYHYTYGTKYWILNDKTNRTYGPAREFADGVKCWYLNGLRHREDGPAIEYGNGDKEWWLNGEYISCTTQKQFEQLMRLKAFW
jgi:hypothetical protein